MCWQMNMAMQLLYSIDDILTQSWSARIKPSLKGERAGAAEISIYRAPYYTLSQILNDVVPVYILFYNIIYIRLVLSSACRAGTCGMECSSAQLTSACCSAGTVCMECNFALLLQYSQVQHLCSRLTSAAVQVLNFCCSARVQLCSGLTSAAVHAFALQQKLIYCICTAAEVCLEYSCTPACMHALQQMQHKAMHYCGLAVAIPGPCRLNL